MSGHFNKLQTFQSRVLWLRFCKKLWHAFLLLTTAWKVSVFGVFLVGIFPHSDWIQRDISYLSVFSLNAEKYGIEKLRIETLYIEDKVYFSDQAFDFTLIKDAKLSNILALIKLLLARLIISWRRPHHKETSPWTGFCMIGTSVMKELCAYSFVCH